MMHTYVVALMGTGFEKWERGIATVTASNVAGFFRECMRNISKAMVDAGCSKTGGE